MTSAALTAMSAPGRHPYTARTFADIANDRLVSQAIQGGAGLPEDFRFYDLRHTGHTLSTQSGATRKDGCGEGEEPAVREERDAAKSAGPAVAWAGADVSDVDADFSEGYQFVGQSLDFGDYVWGKSGGNVLAVGVVLPPPLFLVAHSALWPRWMPASATAVSMMSPISAAVTRASASSSASEARVSSARRCAVRFGWRSIATYSAH